MNIIRILTLAIISLAFAACASNSQPSGSPAGHKMKPGMKM